jgi:hypothetical protein
MTMKIIKNFLDKEQHKKIKNLFLSSNFAWYHIEHQVKEQKDNSYFCHSFIKNGVINSGFYNEDIKSILIKLKVNMLSEVRANLMLRDKYRYTSAYHIDRDFKCNTAIYYVNTNDGYTEFEKSKEKILSEENKIIIFNSKLKHRAVSPTNKQYRFVININYI